MASKLAILEKGIEHKVKLVLLHAFPLSNKLWKHQVEALSSKVCGDVRIQTQLVRYSV